MLLKEEGLTNFVALGHAESYIVASSPSIHVFTQSPNHTIWCLRSVSEHPAEAQKASFGKRLRPASTLFAIILEKLIKNHCQSIGRFQTNHRANSLLPDKFSSLV